ASESPISSLQVRAFLARWAEASKFAGSKKRRSCFERASGKGRPSICPGVRASLHHRGTMRFLTPRFRRPRTIRERRPSVRFEGGFVQTNSSVGSADEVILGFWLDDPEEG